MGPVREVLVIDDDEPWLRAAERGFRALGIAVHTTATRDDGLALAHRHHPDLAIVDVRLGRDAGLELLEPLRAALPSCCIVVLSAYLSVALAVAALRHGADLALFKPVHPAEIIRQVEHREAGIPPAVTPTLARAEWEHIHRVLRDCDGNITEAARRLGIMRQSLQRRLRKHAPQD
jgi:two-component system response regulator RegA